MALNLLHPGSLLGSAHHHVEIHDGHGIAPGAGEDGSWLKLGALEGRSDEGHGGWLIRGGVSACEKNNTAWQGLYRGLLQTVIKALDAKRAEPAHAELVFVDELLAIGFGVFNFMQASFRIYLHHCVFASPLFEA